MLYNISMAKSLKKKKKNKFKTNPLYNGLHFGGKPPKYDKKEQILPIISKYLSKCNYLWFPTKAGLRIALDLSRDAYNEYKKREEFTDTLRKVENIIEEAWSQRLGGQSASGAIFYLKNAFKEDFKDKQEVEHSGGMTISSILDQIEQDKAKQNESKRSKTT